MLIHEYKLKYVAFDQPHTRLPCPFMDIFVFDFFMQHDVPSNIGNSLFHVVYRILLVVLGNMHSKKESKAAVAKRQRRENPTKIEQMKVQRWKWEPHVKQTALLASPVYIGQAQGEEEKTYKRSQNWTGGISSHLLGRPTLKSQGCIFLCFLKNLSCNMEL